MAEPEPIPRRPTQAAPAPPIAPRDEAFRARTDHGDGTVRAAQDWIALHFRIANPIARMVRLSCLAERSFKRRFTAATGLAPIDYVQRLRIEEAKRRLEGSTAPIDAIARQVGYVEAAFFRRLFKRTTGLTPGAWRKRFQAPIFD